jgi:hypothetical protein
LAGPVGLAVRASAVQEHEPCQAAGPLGFRARRQQRATALLRHQQPCRFSVAMATALIFCRQCRPDPGADARRPSSATRRPINGIAISARKQNYPWPSPEAAPSRARNRGMGRHRSVHRRGLKAWRMQSRLPGEPLAERPGVAKMPAADENLQPARPSPETNVPAIGAVKALALHGQGLVYLLQGEAGGFFQHR